MAKTLTEIDVLPRLMCITLTQSAVRGQKGRKTGEKRGGKLRETAPSILVSHQSETGEQSGGFRMPINVYGGVKKKHTCNQSFQSRIICEIIFLTSIDTFFS